LKDRLQRVYETAVRNHPELEVRKAEIVDDAEHHCAAVVFHTTMSGSPRETRLDYNYLSGPEWAELRTLQAKFEALGPGPYLVKSGTTDDHEVGTVFAAVDALKKAAQAGQSVQRYKGLGEMNPEQLWETTMDPKKRTILQVRVEDQVDANEVFTVLMGDQVEPRREFIEKHALDVQNLDV